MENSMEVRVSVVITTWKHVLLEFQLEERLFILFYQAVPICLAQRHVLRHLYFWHFLARVQQN